MGENDHTSSEKIQDEMYPKRKRPAIEASLGTSVRTPDLAARPSTIWRRAVLLVSIGALTYWNSLAGPFIFDDSLSIVSNPRIRDWRALAVLFPQRGSPVAGRPLVNLSFAINYSIGGLNVFPYHVANVGLHFCCTLLRFGVV